MTANAHTTINVAPSKNGQPCALICRWGRLPTGDTETESFTLRIEVQNGDVESEIRELRDRGGTQITDETGRDWFMPWPSLSIQIETEAETSSS